MCGVGYVCYVVDFVWVIVYGVNSGLGFGLVFYIGYYDGLCVYI